MNHGDEKEAESPLDWRYDSLNQLGKQYELGDISDEVYKELKGQILHGMRPDLNSYQARSAIILAVYARGSDLEAVLAQLKARQRGRMSPIIDTLIISISANGRVRVRAEARLTRPIVRGEISIAAAACGLLFPGDALTRDHAGTPLAASFGSFVAPEPEACILREMGSSIPPGTTAIVAVCWASMRNEITEVLGDADLVIQHACGHELTSAVRQVLSAGGNVVNGFPRTYS